MSILSSLKVAYIRYKYKYYRLKIIQNITHQHFADIVTLYQFEGWEIKGDSISLEANIKASNFTLRKGQSVLSCCWNVHSEGTIYGPERIINELARQRNLEAFDSPQ